MDLKWEDSLNTGVWCFDEEHRAILKMLNILRGMMESGDAKDAKNFTRQVIIPYLIKHLRHEEEIMSLMGYPWYEDHQRSHLAIEKLFRESLEAVRSEHKFAVRHFQAIALGWLFGHINKTDKKYGRFFAEKGLIDRLNTVDPAKPPTALIEI